MRILLVSFVGNNESTGMGKWSHRMAGSLRQLGQQPTLWFAEDFPRTRSLGRFAVLLFPVVLAARLWRNRSCFDAVIVHEPAGMWYGLMRKLLKSLPPMTLMSHSVESRHFRELCDATTMGLAVVPLGSRIKTPLFRLWQSCAALKLADHVVCLSKADREYLITKLRCRADNISVQVNGVDEAASGKAIPDGDDSCRVLFVGGWLDTKGRRLLPQIWSLVRCRVSRASLTILGSGQSVQGVVEDFAEPDRASLRVMPNVLNESEMLEEYRKHDLFLMPSISEGSPLSLMEAMAAGLPVVASRVGGIPDIISHEVDGLLFDLKQPSVAAEQVCRLLTNPEDAQRIGKAARERVKTLTWEASAKSLLAAVGKTLAPMDVKPLDEGVPTNYLPGISNQ